MPSSLAAAAVQPRGPRSARTAVGRAFARACGSRLHREHRCSPSLRCCFATVTPVTMEITTPRPPRSLPLMPSPANFALVTDALAQAGLESSNLIVGIDFTRSNEWTGKVSFNRRSLHDIGQTPNPYEQAISIIGRTLSSFDEDNLIPCFGFGDASTHDREVFSFYQDNRPCNGFEEALIRYREIVPKLWLSGPTSFAPMIETAISIVDNSGGQYHVLLIIADGQVTRNVDTALGSFSSQEQDTINAIVKASEYPLSIVLVGVGDGPWDTMRQFDDHIPSRAFDNFQFVNLTEIMCRNIPTSKKETEFALAALMEIPSQYKATLDLQLLGWRKGIPVRSCLPPPIKDSNATSFTSNYTRSKGQKVKLFSREISARFENVPYVLYKAEGPCIWMWTPDMQQLWEKPAILSHVSELYIYKDTPLLESLLCMKLIAE